MTDYSRKLYLRSVAEFIRAFGASLDSRFWLKMVQEETKELLDALRDEPKENVLKELCDVLYVVSGFNLTSKEVGPLMPNEERKEALMIVTDAFEAYQQASKLFRISTINEAFIRVHASNMSKLDENGKPIKREDGKVMKGPNYAPPVLADLV